MKFLFHIFFAVLCIQSSLFAIKIISFGESCTVAGALRTHNIRTEAYPFDWIVSQFDAMYRCLEDDFTHFFTNLHERKDRRGVIDYYGFEFFHDLPTDQTTTEELGEGIISQSILRADWQDYVLFVREKYIRRIKRLQDLLSSTEKIYIIRHFNTSRAQAIKLRDLLRRKYPNGDITIVIVGDGIEMHCPWNVEGIRNFYLDVSKVWNNPARWREIFDILGIE